MAEILHNYKEATGRKYKSDAAALRVHDGTSDTTRRRLDLIVEYTKNGVMVDMSV